MLSLLTSVYLAGLIGFESYTIKQGDTLSAIAYENKVSLSTLSTANPSINDLNKIYIGDEIEIPIYKTQDEIELTEIETDKKQSKQIETDEKQPKEVNNYHEMIVEATAYTAYCDGCVGITKTGIDIRKNPHLKVIAVDPRVIPLNSKVWVEGYGEAIAGDIGGAIKGNKIDVFIPNLEQAYQWGRKQVKIKVYK